MNVRSGGLLAFYIMAVFATVSVGGSLPLPRYEGKQAPAGANRAYRRPTCLRACSTLAPPLAALSVQVAAVEVVYNRDRKLLNRKPPYRLGSEILVGH